MAPIDLAPIAADVAELYAPLAEEKGVSLEIAPSGATMIDGNRSLISQALANLVDNAIKYTPAGGKVTVTASDTPLGVELRVADTGPGIPPARARTRGRTLCAAGSQPQFAGHRARPQPRRRGGAFARCASCCWKTIAPGLRAIIRFPAPAVRARRHDVIGPHCRASSTKSASMTADSTALRRQPPFDAARAERTFESLAGRRLCADSGRSSADPRREHSATARSWRVWRCASTLC